MTESDEYEGEQVYDSEDQYYDEEEEEMERRVVEYSSNGELVYLDEDGNVVESADDYHVYRQS